VTCAGASHTQSNMWECVHEQPWAGLLSVIDTCRSLVAFARPTRPRTTDWIFFAARSSVNWTTCAARHQPGEMRQRRHNQAGLRLGKNTINQQRSCPTKAASRRYLSLAPPLQWMSSGPCRLHYLAPRIQPPTASLTPLSVPSTLQSTNASIRPSVCIASHCYVRPKVRTCLARRLCWYPPVAAAPNSRASRAATCGAVRAKRERARSQERGGPLCASASPVSPNSPEQQGGLWQVDGADRPAPAAVSPRQCGWTRSAGSPRWPRCRRRPAGSRPASGGPAAACGAAPRRWGRSGRDRRRGAPPPAADGATQRVRCTSCPAAHSHTPWAHGAHGWGQQDRS
jgi:hypothetical protein